MKPLKGPLTDFRCEHNINKQQHYWSAYPPGWTAYTPLRSVSPARVLNVMAHQSENMEFKENLYKWINRSLSENIPTETVAYCFNLAENGDDYSVELIGAERFDPSDPDWACEEIFEAKPREIEIPKSISADDWQTCLGNMNKIIQDYVISSETGARVLASSQGIGIGFVDGDLQLIRQP